MIAFSTWVKCGCLYMCFMNKLDFTWLMFAAQFQAIINDLSSSSIFEFASTLLSVTLWDVKSLLVLE